MVSLVLDRSLSPYRTKPCNGEYKQKKYLLYSKSLLLFPCIFCLFIEYLVVPVTGITAYIPTDEIMIDCGGSSSIVQSHDGRSWIGDGGIRFGPIEQQNNKNKLSVALNASQPLPSSVEKVPYSTARLSYSEFTYSFPLSAGQKFIRLYFFPNSYPGFDDFSNKTFFSVKAGPFTLLKNFSALLHAGDELTFVKEF